MQWAAASLLMLASTSLITCQPDYCRPVKLIKNGAAKGNYVLRDGNAKHCGDGCLYSKAGDSLSGQGGPFGYCFEMSDECECADCGPPPHVIDGIFTNCTDLLGNLVDVTFKEISVEDGTVCRLLCLNGSIKQEAADRLLGPADNSRYLTARCKEGIWTDLYGDPMPETIENICTIQKEKLCVPPWSWEGLLDGAYQCDVRKSKVKLDSKGRPVGIPEGDACLLTCTDPVINSFVQEFRVESKITCFKSSGSFEWLTKDNKTLMLENLVDICARQVILNVSSNFLPSMGNITAVRKLSNNARPTNRSGIKPFSINKLSVSGIISFPIDSQGIWYLSISSLDGQHYDKMMMRNISNSEVVPITLDYKSRMYISVTSIDTGANMSSPVVNCQLVNKDLKVNSNLTEACRAWKFNEACKQEKDLNSPACDINAKEMPGECDKKIEAAKLDEMLAKFKNNWNASLPGVPTIPLVLTVPTAFLYNCTATSGPGFETKQIDVRSPIIYESFSFTDKLPSITITVKLNSSGAAVKNYNLKIFNNKTELLLDQSTDTDNVIVELPLGTLFIVVEKPNIKQNSQVVQVTPQTTNITILVTEIFQMKLSLKEISGQSISKITKLKVEQNRHWATPSSTEFDSISDFESKIYPEKKWNVIRMQNKTRPVNPNYVLDQVMPVQNISGGYLTTNLSSGHYSIHFSVSQDVKYMGYMRDIAYNRKDYFPDWYYINIRGDEAAANTDVIQFDQTRLLVPRVILSVAVFDEDCYEFCDEKLNIPCIQGKCQSIQNIGPESGISIRVECASPGCTENSLVKNMIKYYSFLGKGLVTTQGLKPPTTMFLQEVGYNFTYNISCWRNDPGYVQIPPIHTRRMIENKYLPCLLHKKMCGPGECDPTRKRFRMRMSLGWGMPNKKISYDYNLMVAFFNGTNGKFLCTTGARNLETSSCNDFRVQEQASFRELTTDFRCHNMPQFGFTEVRRDRCCSPSTNNTKECRENSLGKGHGLETLVVYDNVIPPQEQSPVVALVYVVDVYRTDYSFADADIEVTYQYKESGTDKVDIARMAPSDLAIRGDNTYFLSCAYFRQDSTTITNVRGDKWMHLDSSTQDMGHYFGMNGPFGSVCNSCLLLFCDTEDLGLIKKCPIEQRKRCCCCAIYMEATMNGFSRQSFECPYKELEISRNEITLKFCADQFQGGNEDSNGEDNRIMKGTPSEATRGKRPIMKDAPSGNSSIPAAFPQTSTQGKNVSKSKAIASIGDSSTTQTTGIKGKQNFTPQMFSPSTVITGTTKGAEGASNNRSQAARAGPAIGAGRIEVDKAEGQPEGAADTKAAKWITSIGVIDTEVEKKTTAAGVTADSRLLEKTANTTAAGQLQSIGTKDGAAAIKTTISSLAGEDMSNTSTIAVEQNTLPTVPTDIGINVKQELGVDVGKRGKQLEKLRQFRGQGVKVESVDGLPSIGSVEVDGGKTSPVGLMKSEAASVVQKDAATDGQENTPQAEGRPAGNSLFSNQPLKADEALDGKKLEAEAASDSQQNGNDVEAEAAGAEPASKDQNDEPMTDSGAAPDGQQPAGAQGEGISPGWKRQQRRRKGAAGLIKDQVENRLEVGQKPEVGQEQQPDLVEQQPGQTGKEKLQLEKEQREEERKQLQQQTEEGQQRLGQEQQTGMEEQKNENEQQLLEQKQQPTGMEQPQIGKEQQLSGQEQQKSETELQQIGKEQQPIGQEQQQIVPAQHQTGEKLQQIGQELQQTGQELQEIGEVSGGPLVGKRRRNGKRRGSKRPIRALDSDNQF